MPDKINITRIYSNENERTALLVAESLNYTKLLGVSPLFGFSEEKSEYESYVYPVYINNYTLNFYLEKIEYLQRKLKGCIKLEYIATAQFVKSLTINITNLYDCDAKFSLNNTVFYLTFWGRSGYADILVVNETGKLIFYHYENLSIGYHWIFNNAYFVKMSLTYSEFYGPLTAYFFEVGQVVILSKDFSLKMIFTFNKTYAAS